MNNEQLIASIAEFAASKKVDRPTVIHMLRDVLYSLIEKKFGATSDFDIVIDAQKGDLQIWHSRTIVEDGAEDAHQYDRIPLSEARKIEKDFEIGEEVAEEITLDMFGRRAVMEALRLFMKKKHMMEQQQLYEQYSSRIGHIISAEIAYTNPRYAILYDDAKNELILPKSAQIPRERFRKGAQVQVLVDEVTHVNEKVNIVLNRNSVTFIKELLTLEIPEILDKNVLIKGVGRIPGVRSKVVVESQDDRIDAAGACIGPSGRRIQTISKNYLSGERVDIITYTSNLSLLIKRIAGIPSTVKVTEQEGSIFITTSTNQLDALHHNLPFISQLLNCPIQIVRDHNSTDEDVHLDEFSDEIEEATIATIQATGITTARSVLVMPKEAFIAKTGLEKSIADKVYSILTKEFEP